MASSPDGNQLALVRSLRQQNEHLADELKRLKAGGPGDTFDGMVPSVKSDLEPRVSRLEMGFCVAFLILAGLVCGLYLYTNAKFDTVNEKMGQLSVQITQTNGKIDLLLERVPAKK